MNYYAARQRQDTGRFDYTCMNDGQIWRVGYCRDHNDGHATADEACEHYRQYLLDTDLRLGRQRVNAQYKCEVCGEFTSGFAEINHGMYSLCEKHNNRAEVEKLFEVGEIISSY